METTATTPPKGPKPKLRGISHLIGAVGTLPAGYLLRARVANPETLSSATIYVIGLFLLLGVSALYHVPMWSPRVRANLRRVDRSMIYIFVVGTYAPMVVALGPAIWPWTLHAVGAAALTGVGLAVFVTGAPRWLTALTYVVLGWGAVVVMPAVHLHYGPRIFWGITIGGILYTVGAIAYAFKRPNPFPTVFGYHEIFHLLVLIAAAIHYAVLFKILT